MSYIWDVAIKLKKKGVNISNIDFQQPEIYSPYMEVSFEDINFNVDKDLTQVEVNAFYRFFTIFDSLLDPNHEDNMEFKKALFSLLIHFLLELDLKMGFSVKEYVKTFLFNDIKNGIYGEDMAENIKYFNYDEINIVMSSICNMYENGMTLHMFNVILLNIFKNAATYIDKETEYGFFIYVGEPETEESHYKLDFLLSTFLPLKFNAYVCWDKHFPVLGVDKTMIIENNVIF